MQISTLHLKGFRSYKDRKFEFKNGVNIIVGKNAQGKTNILEAIFFMIIGKSFRTSKDKEVINWTDDAGKIEGEFKKKYRDVKIEMFFSKIQAKAVKIDGISIKKLGQLLSTVNGVFFSPDELKLIKESPDERRRFMNIILCQTDRKYYYLLGRYEKVLQNRNKLLKTTKDFNVLKQTIYIWDKALCDYGKQIYAERQKLIDQLSPYVEKAGLYLSSGKETITLKYRSSFEGDDYALQMEKSLQENLEKDYKRGFTSVGIHRDEIDIYLNGTEVKSFGSQGQQRTVALALKLAELEIIKNRTGEEPLLLLDDVFSELDEERRKKLLKFTSKAQTIITCTEFDMQSDVNIIKI